MKPSRVNKVLRKDFSSRYGIKVDNLRLTRRYGNSLFPHITADEHVEICFVQVSFSGRKYTYVFKARETEVDGEIKGYLENPSVTPSLVSYGRNPDYILTAYAGTSLGDLRRGELSRDLFVEVGQSLRELKNNHGDLDLSNLIRNEIPYNDPSITRPNSDKNVLFIDFCYYGVRNKTYDLAELSSSLVNFDFHGEELVKYVSGLFRGFGRHVDIRKFRKNLRDLTDDADDVKRLVRILEKISN